MFFCDSQNYAVCWPVCVCAHYKCMNVCVYRALSLLDCFCFTYTHILTSGIFFSCSIHPSSLFFCFFYLLHLTCSSLASLTLTPALSPYKSLMCECGSVFLIQVICKQAMSVRCLPNRAVGSLACTSKLHQSLSNNIWIESVAIIYHGAHYTLYSCPRLLNFMHFKQH